MFIVLGDHLESSTGQLTTDNWPQLTTGQLTTEHWVTTLKYGLPTFNIINLGHFSSDSSLAIHDKNEYL